MNGWIIFITNKTNNGLGFNDMSSYVVDRDLLLWALIATNWDPSTAVGLITSQPSRASFTQG